MITPGGRRAGGPAASTHGPWIVALPAWGPRYVDVLIRHTLPALMTALGHDSGAQLRVYTDSPGKVRAYHSNGAELLTLPVPGPDRSFMSLSTAHRDAMASAGKTGKVLLLTADMVVSRELVETCDRLLAAGKQLVCCCAMRALEDRHPPLGATGRELLEWAWANRHPMTRECTWPEGRSYDLWRTYYEQGDEVAARVFLPHPLAVVPGGRQLKFAPTIDVNLTSNFSQSLTHMITSPEEGAVVELSPADKEFLYAEQPFRERLAGNLPTCPQLIRCTNPRHRMFFGKRVVIRGSGGDCGDDEVVRRILG